WRIVDGTNRQNKRVEAGERTVAHRDGDGGGAELVGQWSGFDRAIGSAAAQGQIDIWNQSVIGGGRGHNQSARSVVHIRHCKGQIASVGVFVDAQIGSVRNGRRIIHRVNRQNKRVEAGE